MWKVRVRTCLQTAINEVVNEAQGNIDPDATIRTELDGMVRRTMLLDMENRLKQVLTEVEAIPERKTRR